MRAYGLIEKRGVKVTDIGKSLTYGATEEEKNEALKEAVLNIPLWKEFYRRYGANLPKADFWADLTKITALEAPDAKKIEEIVRKAYLDDSQYVKEEKKPKGDISGMEPRAQVNISMSTIEIHAGQFNQTIPWTEKGIELGKDFLELLRAQMPKPEKRKKEKEVTPE